MNCPTWHGHAAFGCPLVLQNIICSTKVSFQEPIPCSQVHGIHRPRCQWDNQNRWLLSASLPSWPRRWRMLELVVDWRNLLLSRQHRSWPWLQWRSIILLTEENIESPETKTKPKQSHSCNGVAQVLNVMYQGHTRSESIVLTQKVRRDPNHVLAGCNFFDRDYGFMLISITVETNLRLSCLLIRNITKRPLLNIAILADIHRCVKDCFTLGVDLANVRIFGSLFLVNHQGIFQSLAKYST